MEDCVSCKNAAGQSPGGTAPCPRGCPEASVVAIPIQRECANIQQLCNAQPVVYYDSFNTAFPLSGLVTVRNTGDCQMSVDVFQSTNIRITQFVPPNTTRFLDVPNIVRIEISCAGDGTTLCAGMITLDLYRLINC